MSKSILILGDSGTGKTTSMRNLPHEETFVISTLGKKLPFRGSASMYKAFKRNATEGDSGNFFCSIKPDGVKKAINYVDKERPDIKYIFIDDLGYVVMNEFIGKALEKGFDKFSQIGKDFSDILTAVQNTRDDLFVIATMHIETDKQGKTKPKTVGNMIDQYINIEGQFDNVFHTAVVDGEYKFITKNDGIHMAHTWMELFDQNLIENDLLKIVQAINNYINEDIKL